MMASYEIDTITDEKLSYRKVKHVIRGDKGGSQIQSLLSGSRVWDLNHCLCVHKHIHTLLC